MHRSATLGQTENDVHGIVPKSKLAGGLIEEIVGGLSLINLSWALLQRSSMLY